MSRVRRAIERARDDVAHLTIATIANPSSAPDTATRRERTLAIGDPQAPLETFLRILDIHGALGDDGRLLPSVALVSMGDHFDWGDVGERERAASEAHALLSWLAAHPPEQVTILAGNHDLARVGELDGIDDATFADAQALADASYLRDEPGALRRFRHAHPRFATDELVARDLSTFRVEQRELVERLLEAKRMRLAHAAHGMLFVHAGITALELDALALPVDADASAIAHRLNEALDEAVAARAARAGPLVIPGIHQPGDGTREGGGALYHRPSLGLDDEERQELARPPPRRRFPIDALPRGLTQVIGHIRDGKCRELLAPIADAHAPVDGPLRTLVVEAGRSRYVRGVEGGDEKSARVLFTDNGMSRLRDNPAAYEILDVGALDVARHGPGHGDGRKAGHG